MEPEAEVEQREFQQVCAEVLPFGFVFCRLLTMANKQAAKTIELNDGTRMPLLGLGTWKVWSLQYSL